MSGIVGTSSAKSKGLGRSSDTSKAWVQWDGSGTAAIKNSYNVSSLSDIGTGHYEITLAVAMKDYEYAITSGHSANGSFLATPNSSTTNISCQFLNNSGSNTDSTYCVLNVWEK